MQTLSRNLDSSSHASRPVIANVTLQRDIAELRQQISVGVSELAAAELAERNAAQSSADREAALKLAIERRRAARAAYYAASTGAS